MLPKPKSQPSNNSFQGRFTGASDDPILEARLTSLLEGIYYLHHKEIDLGLDRTYRFLERIGNPHLHLPTVVHIAGTNGKGSTTATLRALLEASGHKVHVYTSPHLVHPTERIRLAGAPITSQALLDILNECIDINNGDPITFFELFTCAALLAFQRTPADFVLLETGMGGRLDTTNVIPNPACTIITTISYDHQSFLGDTLAKIAFEKAGIMKAGCPCVIGYQFQEVIEKGVLEVFHKTSQALSTQAPLHIFGAQWSSEANPDGMVFRYGNDSIALPKPCLLGTHQIWNAGAALEAFRLIAPTHFKPQILSTALGKIDWPARLQTLEKHPFKELLPKGWEMFLDGGHNDSAGTVLAQQMDEWVKTSPRPLHLIVGMMARKDAAAFLKPLLPYVHSLTLTEVEGEKDSFAIEDLEKIANSTGFKTIHTAQNITTAVKTLSDSEDLSIPSRIVIAGSLFLAGQVLAAE